MYVDFSAVFDDVEMIRINIQHAEGVLFL